MATFLHVPGSSHAITTARIMRVALTSYPMLWQRTGGLQVQVSETRSALCEQGVDARLFNPIDDQLEDYDLLHVFGAINGNHRIVEAGWNAGVPVVISSVLHPPFSRWDGRRARLAARIHGKLTRWQFSTAYEQTRQALVEAQAVIALGQAERYLLVGGYGVPPERVCVIPNGIADRFFKATPDAFRSHSGITGPFVLHVSSITPYKNPLISARVAARLGLPLVLIGAAARGDSAYLEQCRQAATAGCHYMGTLGPDSELLSSAYAAASILLLPSRSEVMPLVVLEALAAGTPVVMTDKTSLVLNGSDGALATVNPEDEKSVEDQVRKLISRPALSDVCRQLVEDMTWQSASSRIATIYIGLVSGVSAAS